MARIDPVYEDMLAMVEWEYTAGQSFSVGDDDVLRWMIEHGWTFQAPPEFRPTPFEEFPENQGADEGLDRDDSEPAPSDPPGDSADDPNRNDRGG